MKKKEYLDKFLNDSEKLAVQMFVENDLQREAVKKVLLAGLYRNGTLNEGEAPDFTINSALSAANVDGRWGATLTNEQIGANLRAYCEGLQLIEEGFNALTCYKKEEKMVDNNQNEAR